MSHNNDASNELSPREQFKEGSKDNMPAGVFVILAFNAVLGMEINGNLTEQEISDFYNGKLVSAIYISLHIQAIAYFIAIYG